MSKFSVILATVVFVVAFSIGIVGCSHTPSTPTSPVVVVPPSPAAVQAQIDSNASLIGMATKSLVAIGLTAVPDKTEADQIATDALIAVNTDVLPLLNGDEGALVSGVQQILDLKAFDKPSLAKFKAIAELGLPLLRNYLPTDLVDGQVNKVRPDVKAYLTAFFTGVRDGCNAYKGTTTSKSVGPQVKDLRAKLAK